jgi:hypothetical protein
MWLSEADDHGGTPASTLTRRDACEHQQMAPAAFSPPCEAPGLLIVGGRAAAERIKGGSRARVCGAEALEHRDD